jgi:primosomal protein N' (replication factor Y) (superfamily II helicase)
MYQSQILERRNFKYPPFYRLILLSLRHKDARILNDAARDLAHMLRDKLQNRVLGPEYPLISKIKNLYIKNIMLKLERSENLNQQKHEILETISRFKGEASYKAVRVIIDVDPV